MVVRAVDSCGANLGNGVVGQETEIPAPELAEGEDAAAVVFGLWVDPGVEAGEGGDGLERATRGVCAGDCAVEEGMRRIVRKRAGLN